MFGYDLYLSALTIFLKLPVTEKMLFQGFIPE